MENRDKPVFLISGGTSGIGLAAARGVAAAATAKEVADAIAFLCSPEAAKTTGQAISVNGGISAA